MGIARSHDDLEIRVRERTAELEKANQRLQQEITEHKMTAEALKKTEGRSRMLLERLNDGVGIFNDVGEILYANHKFCEMSGYPFQELQGINIANCVAKEDRAYVKEQIEKRKYGARDSYEFVFVTKWGERKCFLSSPEPLYDSSGNYEGSIVVLTDITDVRKMDDALRKSEEMTRVMLNSSGDSAILLTLDGTILAANNMICGITGISFEKMAGASIHSIFPNKIKYLDRFLQFVSANHEPCLVEEEFGERTYSITAYPIMEEGKTGRIAVYARDITELKRAEQHIHSLTQDLIKAQEFERQRIARDLHDNVAQDLATLKIYCDTLFSVNPLPPWQIAARFREFSKVLQRSIKEIRNLAYNLQPPGLEELGLVTVIKRYCDDFSERNQLPVGFSSAGITVLHLSYDAQINLYRVIQEALNNVNKHAAASQVTIRLIASFPKIILRIADNGRGFDVKERLAEARNEKRMGVRSMEERVMLLGGKMKIHANHGEGTRLNIEIPLKENVISPGSWPKQEPRQQ